MRSDTEEHLSLQDELAALPAISPDSDGWPAIRRGLQKHRPGYKRSAAWSLAAAIALATGLWTFLPGPVPVPAVQKNDASYWIAQSQILQQALLRMDTDHRVLSGAEAQIEASLAHEIAFVDASLESNAGGKARTNALWQRRTELMVQLLALKMNQRKYVNTNRYGI